jgi:hypothetical protein
VVVRTGDAQLIHQLHDVPQARTTIVRERSREIQRLEKLLEDSGIKLSSAARDTTGERRPDVLADMATRRLGEDPQTQRSVELALQRSPRLFSESSPQSDRGVHANLHDAPPSTKMK